jgi:hypothetical protein
MEQVDNCSIVSRGLFLTSSTCESGVVGDEMGVPFAVSVSSIVPVPPWKLFSIKSLSWTLDQKRCSTNFRERI